jgi:hypothetical protein
VRPRLSTCAVVAVAATLGCAARHPNGDLQRPKPEPAFAGGKVSASSPSTSRFERWTEADKAAAKAGIDDLLRQNKLRYLKLETGDVGIRDRFWQLLPRSNQREFAAILSVYFQLQGKPGELKLWFYDESGQRLARGASYSPTTDRLTID